MLVFRLMSGVCDLSHGIITNSQGKQSNKIKEIDCILINKENKNKNFRFRKVM